MTKRLKISIWAIAWVIIALLSHTTFAQRNNTTFPPRQFDRRRYPAGQSHISGNSAPINNQDVFVVDRGKYAVNKLSKDKNIRYRETLGNGEVIGRRQRQSFGNRQSLESDFRPKSLHVNQLKLATPVDVVEQVSIKSSDKSITKRRSKRDPLLIPRVYTSVTCKRESNESSVRFSNYISSIISDVTKSSSVYITPHCPCAWDPRGSCRQASHICFGPNSTYICTFVVINATVTALGAILAGNPNSPEALTLRDETLCGGHVPQYQEELVNVYTESLAFAIDAFLRKRKHIPYHVDKLIPIRTRWDDGFTHLSFQSMPLIGLVYEFHPELFFTAHWQTSLFTAAILLLLGVKAEKLIIKESAHANEVWLPWMQYWNPFNIPPLPGVANRISLLATDQLLRMNISSTVISRIGSLVPLDYKYSPLRLKASVSTLERYVVYFNRTATTTRNVINELDILQAIQKNLKSGFRLVVLPSLPDVQTIEEMYGRWQQYARIVNNAIVIMGPHGGALNNLMWAPDNCDFIEFNENPDDEHISKSHGQKPVRRCFMNAFLAKSGNMSRYWTIQPVKRHVSDFYNTQRMKVLVRDVLQVLSQVKHDNSTGLLKDNNIWETMETEEVGVFK